ncbi:MAG: SIS domain-containing protein, partial [Candidatus Promineifilaceae bacterium]
TGCGSTYYLSQTAASLFESLSGVPAAALPGSEFLLFPQRVLAGAEQTLLVTISRSGTTTETLKAQQAFREHGGRTAWCITCYDNSPLAAGSDLVLPAVAAQERSVAQTKSFSSMLLLAQLLAAAVGGQELATLQALPALGADLLQRAEPLMAELGGRLDLSRFTFLGSGYEYGVASEAMLKMTEMSLSFSNAFHFLEYRHGPMSMATEELLISGLLSAQGFGHEQQVLKEMRALGAATLALNPTSTAAETDWQVALPAQLPAWMRPVLYLPPLQLLAYYRAMAKGLNPDNPRNLTAVVELGAL